MYIAPCTFFHKPRSAALPRPDSAPHLTATLLRRALSPSPPPRWTRARRWLAGCGCWTARAGAPPWILALGKAALPMAQAAVEVLRERGLEPAGGLVVAPAPAPPPHPALPSSPGDHPEPGPGSLAAAAGARASGGAGRVAATRSGCCSPAAPPACSGRRSTASRPRDLTRLYSLLLGSGLDITAMNRIRKRFSRWGGGRLAVRARPGPGPGLRRLRRHRRRSRRPSAPAPASPIPRPRPKCASCCSGPASGTAFPQPARDQVRAGRSGTNGRNAEARRPSVRARDPRADRQ